MDGAPVAQESIAIAADLGSDGAGIGLVHRGWGPILTSESASNARLGSELWLTRDADGRVGLDRLVIEEGIVTIRSRPREGDLLEVGPPPLHPVWMLERDDLRVWMPIELLFPSLLVANEDDRGRFSLSFGTMLGVGVDGAVPLGTWTLRAGGVASARHRFGTAKRTNAQELHAEAFGGLVSPRGVSVGIRGDAYARVEPRDGVPGVDSRAVGGGIELGFTPKPSWRTDLVVLDPRIRGFDAWNKGCGVAEVHVEGSFNHASIALSDDATGTVFATIEADGHGEWTWTGPNPLRAIGDVRAVAGHDEAVEGMNPFEWNRTSFHATVGPDRYTAADPLVIELSTEGDCAASPDQVATVVFADGSRAEAPIVDGRARVEHAAVAGPAQLVWTWHGVELYREDLDIRPWPACPDADGDGVRVCGGDCDDSDPAISPLAKEKNGDGIDQDCDGINGKDTDKDGWERHQDCDDTRDDVHPGAPEVADGRDNDCDGTADVVPAADCAPADPLPPRWEGATDLGTWGVESFRRTVRVGAPGGWVRFTASAEPDLRIEASGVPGWTVALYRDPRPDRRLDGLAEFDASDRIFVRPTLSTGFGWTHAGSLELEGRGLFGGLRAIAGMAALPLAVGIIAGIATNDPWGAVRVTSAYLDFTFGGPGHGLSGSPPAPRMSVYWVEAVADDPRACPLTIMIRAR
jgi:hypothetical protein